MTDKSTLETLSKGDTIKNGIYAGMKVSECLRVYGKKSIIGIVKYYDLDEEILKEYHVHLEPHKEEEDNTPVSETSSGTWKDKSIVAPTVKGVNPWLNTSKDDEDVEGYCNYLREEGDLDSWCIYKDGTFIHFVDNALARRLDAVEGTFDPSKYEEMVESMKQKSIDWKDELNFNEESRFVLFG